MTSTPDKPSRSLATAINAVLGLQDLVWIDELYGHSIDPDETKELRTILDDAFHTAMQSDDLREIAEKLEAIDVPSPLSTRPSIFLAILMMQYPSFDTNAERPEDISATMLKVAAESRQFIELHLKHVADRIVEIKIVDCRAPLYMGMKTGDVHKRTLRVLMEYWARLRQIVNYQMRAPAGIAPHPLTPILLNLRDRIAACMQELGSGMKDAKDGIANLIDILVGPDPTDLSAVQEWTIEQLARVECCLQEARLRIGSTPHNPNPIEQAFLYLVDNSIPHWQKGIEDHWAKVLRNLERDRNQSTEAATPQAVEPTPDWISEVAGSGETQIYEFKEWTKEPPNSLAKGVAGMVHNRDGGYVFCGIRDDGTIAGLGETFKEFEPRVRNLVRNKLKPLPTIRVQCVEVGTRQVAVLVVPPWDGNTVYYFDEKVYVRTGTHTFVADPQTIRKLHEGKPIN